MKAWRAITIAGALLLVAGLSLRNVRRSSVAAPRAATPPHPTAEVSRTAVAKPENPLSPPSVAAVRSEVKEDPEVTPPSILAFAQRLGERMEVALHSESAATGLFADLETCVTSDSVPSVTRALCLDDARRLADTYAGLTASYQSLRDASSDDLKKLARFAELGR